MAMDLTIYHTHIYKLQQTPVYDENPFIFGHGFSHLLYTFE